MAKRRVLVTNDDGIDAPGLQAIVKALAAREDVGEVLVCAPVEEQSGKSQAITLARYLSVHPRANVEGATDAYAVDGTPADCVMLALHSPLFGGSSTAAASFDLVVSGINRGDNCGLHIIYSGTVGAAREAACKGVPAIALSLDSHSARRVEDYGASARLGAELAAALLAVLAEAPDALPDVAEGLVLNVNVPRGELSAMRGVTLSHQGTGTFFPAFAEVAEGKGPHLPEIEEHTPETRVFRNFAGGYREDGTEGSDMKAVAAGFVSVTPLGLRSDLLFKTRTAARGGGGGGENGGGGGGENGGGSGGITSGVSAAQERHARGCVGIAAQVVLRASAALGMAADSVADVEWPIQ